MTQEIQKCPFCGGEAWGKWNYGGERHKTPFYYVWIECDFCGARSKAATTAGEPREIDAYERPICWWNRRERTDGSWIRIQIPRGNGLDGTDELCKCSKCGETAPAGGCFFDNETNFCPNCGARMKKSETGGTNI